MQKGIMKKVQSFALTATMLATVFTGFYSAAVSAAEGDVNLVKNGDFSQGFKYWDTSKMSENVVSIVDDYKGKAHALKIDESVNQTTNTADGYAQRVFQVIPVVPGASYLFGYDLITETSHNSGPAVQQYDLFTGELTNTLANNNWNTESKWTTRNPSTNSNLAVANSSANRKVYIPTDVDTVVVSFPRAQKDSYFTNVQLIGPAPAVSGTLKYRNIYPNNAFDKGDEGLGEEGTYTNTLLPGSYSLEMYQGYRCLKVENTANANSGKYFEVYANVKAGHKYVVTYKKSITSSDGTTGHNVDSSVTPITEDGTFLAKIASCNWAVQKDYYQMILGGENIGSPYGSKPMTIPEGCNKIAIRFFTNGGPTADATYTDRWADIRIYDVDPDPVSITSATVPQGAALDGNVISATVPHNQTSVSPVCVASPSDSIIKYYSDDSCTDEITSMNDLQYGVNTAYAVVIAKTGETSSKYTVNITREYSDECDVTSVVSPEDAVLSGTGISATVSSEFTSKTIALNVSDDATWKLYSDAACTSEITNKTMSSMTVGDNVAYAKVTAQNGVTAKVYTITIHRNPSTACDVTQVIAPQSGSIEANNIAATVPYATQSIALDVSVSENAAWKVYSDEQCTAELTDKTFANMAVGVNTCYIKVTAEDNTSVKVYTVKITREQNGEKNIVSVSVPENATVGTDTIDASVAVNISSIVVDVTVSTEAAWALYSDEGCTNIIENKTMALDYGENTAFIKVAAQNGTSKVYQLNVSRNKSSEKQILSVTSPAGAVITGKDITSTVDNSINETVVSVTVSDDANWELYLDSACTQSVADKKLNLSVGNNTAYIKVTAQDGSTETYTLKVTRSPKAVTGVSLSSSAVTLYAGSTKTIKATVTPADAEQKDILWSTSSNKVATVNNGVIKALSAGSATITVKTVDGNFTATCKVTVKNVVAKSIKLNKKTKTLKVKRTYNLKATFNPKNTTVKKVSWKSSKPKIAKVSNTGKVTALRKGKAVITAKTTNGKKATCKITVK